MDFINPPYLFVLVDGRISPRIFSSVYSRYAESVSLSGNEAILDFGGGSGALTMHLASRLGDGGSITCLDICPPLIRIAERRLKKYTNARCFLGPIEKLEADEEPIDVAVFHNALHDVPPEERDETMRVLGRLLKPDATVYLREPTKESHGMRPREIEQLMEKIGMKKKESREYKLFPIGPVYEAVYAREDTSKG